MPVIQRFEIIPNAIKGHLFEVFFNAPIGAKPISVGIQNGKSVMWAEIYDPDAQIVTQIIYCVTTNCGKIPTNCRFIGTIIDNIEWHIYSPVL